METYRSFAAVYDLFMDNIDYHLWSRYMVKLLQENGVSDGLVLDLGCGTGSMTELLAASGFDMIGLDNSADMLEVAEAKRRQSGRDILYLLQDMRSFELYGTVRAVVSVCDAINYILDRDELRAVFCLVNNYLDPGGVFIFDLNTVYKYETLMADHTFAENRSEGSFIWDNYYDHVEMINEYDLTLFIPEAAGLYRKYEELHYQKAYALETVRTLLGQAGMEFVAAYDAFSDQPPAGDSERICIVARAAGQKHFTAAPDTRQPSLS